MTSFWASHTFGNGTHQEGDYGEVWNTGMPEGYTLLRSMIFAKFWVTYSLVSEPWQNGIPLSFGYFQWTTNDHDASETPASNPDQDWVAWEVINLELAGASNTGDSWDVRYEGFCRLDVQSRRKAITSGPTGMVGASSFGVPVGSEYDVTPFLCQGTIRNLWWHQ